MSAPALRTRDHANRDPEPRARDYNTPVAIETPRTPLAVAGAGAVQRPEKSGRVCAATVAATNASNTARQVFSNLATGVL